MKTFSYLQIQSCDSSAIFLFALGYSRRQFLLLKTLYLASL